MGEFLSHSFNVCVWMFWIIFFFPLVNISRTTTSMMQGNWSLWICSRFLPHCCVREVLDRELSAACLLSATSSFVFRKWKVRLETGKAADSHGKNVYVKYYSNCFCYNHDNIFVLPMSATPTAPPSNAPIHIPADQLPHPQWKSVVLALSVAEESKSDWSSCLCIFTNHLRQQPHNVQSYQYMKTQGQ